MAGIKELHVWLDDTYPKENKMFFSLDSTLTELEKGSSVIHTTQTYCFSTEWIDKGYRIFAHLLDGTTIEIKLGSNSCTPKEIRKAHNISRMLLANAFGLARRI